MYASMTTGTTSFLKNLIESQPKVNFYLMKYAGTTLVYYEHKKKKSLFVSGKSFKILKRYGDMQQLGFVSIHHVPITEDVQAIFEEKVSSILLKVEQVTGVNSIRLLQAIKGQTYVILIVWSSEKNYQQWEKEKIDFSTLVRQPAYFGDRAFTQTYRMLKEDDEESN